MKTKMPFPAPSWTQRWPAWGFAAFTILLLLSPAAALNPSVIKLHARNTVSQSSPLFGSCVAANEKWILVGEPENRDLGSNTGAVHVFNAVTGAYVRKLRGLDTESGDAFGTSVAVSGNTALIGAPRDNDPVAGIDAGSAYVFNLATGAQVRKMLAADAGVSFQFGTSVALNGNRALIGAPGAFGLGLTGGAAYLLNIATGVQQAKLHTAEESAGDQLGFSVALGGTWALVGAPFGHGGVANSGSAYLFDANSTALITLPVAELRASDSVSGHKFGCSVALSGNWALVGCTGAAGLVPDSGAAFLFDITNPSASYFEVEKLFSDDGVINDNFGISVALNGNLALIGAEVGDGLAVNSGAAYLFDVATNTQLHRLTAPDGFSNDVFGGSVALAGDAALIGARQDNDLGGSTGSAYVFRPVAGLFPLTKVTALKDFAPNTTEARFQVFGDAFLNDQAEVILTATLSGVGAPLATNQGVWNSLFDDTLRLRLRKGGAAPVAPGTVSGLFKPIANRDDLTLYEATYSGANVTAANNRALIRDTGSSRSELLRLGDTPLGDDEEVSKFFQIVQSINSSDRQAVAFQLAPGSGTLVPVTAAIDTGILVLNETGDEVGTVREGDPSPAPGAPDFGQFSRVAFQDNQTVFTSGIQGAAATNQGVFRSNPGVANIFVAQKGFNAPGTPAGVLFSAFTGETTSPNERAVFRASLSGPGVTTANDQGLWSEHTATVELVARKGDALPASLGFAAGVSWNRFINFWGIAEGVGQVLFLASIKGPGITPANDVGLWLMHGAASYQLLLREGEVVPDCATGTIGTIQRVVAVPATGHYAVLVSLTNSAPTSNQALFTGRTGLGNAESPLRRPFLKLRKGRLYEGPSAITTLKSLSLPATAFDATGAGAKGLGQPINEVGELVLPAVFNNGVTELVNGAP
jgi:hypothetical protein